MKGIDLGREQVVPGSEVPPSWSRRNPQMEPVVGIEMGWKEHWEVREALHHVTGTVAQLAVIRDLLAALEECNQANSDAYRASKIKEKPQ